MATPMIAPATCGCLLWRDASVSQRLVSGETGHVLEGSSRAVNPASHLLDSLDRVDRRTLEVLRLALGPPDGVVHRPGLAIVQLAAIRLELGIHLAPDFAGAKSC